MSPAARPRRRGRTGGLRLRRESRAPLQTPPCCAASPPRAGERRAPPGQPGRALPAPGSGRTALALRSGPGTGGRERGSRRREGGLLAPRCVPPPFLARRGRAVAGCPPGPGRPWRSPLSAPGCARAGRRGAPGASHGAARASCCCWPGSPRSAAPQSPQSFILVALCPWVMSRSPAIRRPQSDRPEGLGFSLPSSWPLSCGMTSARCYNGEG